MCYQFCLIVLIVVGLSANCSAQKNPVDVSTSQQIYGKISETAKLSEARASHTATLLPDGKVIIIGGMERNGVFFESAEIFNPQTDSFIKAKGKMSIKRVGHTATLLSDGKILIVGGWSNRDLPESSAEIYDSKTDTFTSVENAHHRLSGHTAMLLDNGKVLIAGGSNGKSGLSDVELFDQQTKTFTIIGRMQNARIGAAAVKLADGRVLLTGGAVNQGQILSSAEIFDPKTNSFTATKAMNVVRYKHDSIRLSDGRVLVFGGSDNRDWNGQYKSAEIFDPKTNEFTPTNDMNFARFKIEGTSVLLKDGKVFIGGGGTSAEVFNPQTNTFTKTAGEFGIPLHFASVTLLDDKRALIVGGYGNGTPQAGPISTNRAWIFKL